MKALTDFLMCEILAAETHRPRLTAATKRVSSSKYLLEYVLYKLIGMAALPRR
jgi:hypothetical protein